MVAFSMTVLRRHMAQGTFSHRCSQQLGLAGWPICACLRMGKVVRIAPSLDLDTSAQLGSLGVEGIHI